MSFLKIKETLLFILLIFLFYIIIFLFKNYIFIFDKNFDEEKYISENFSNLNSYNDDIKLSKILNSIKEEEKKYRSKKISYFYFPNTLGFEKRIKDYKKLFDVFYNSKTINSKIESLEFNIYKEKFDVRGRLKNKKIHIFGIYNMTFKEAFSVSVHEFGHFLDIYILNKKLFKDISDDFYNISWTEKNILKNGAKIEDFVSGYAMTNMYEDFAESFNFYVLHNKDFYKKTILSENIKQKYNFFKEKIFKQGEFITDDYYIEIKEKNIWDTTKQDFNFENFEKYIKSLE